MKIKKKKENSKKYILLAVEENDDVDNKSKYLKIYKKTYTQIWKHSLVTTKRMET